MAKATDIKTYYLIDQSGNISTKTKIIYSPFNIKVEWRTRDEDNYWSDPKKVIFSWWVYETDDVEEQEFLDHWNEAVWLNWYKLSNWKRFWNDGTHKINADKPKQKVKTEIQIEEKIVQTIPKNIAEMMTHKQLKELCESWDVWVEDWDTKEKLIERLQDTKHLT